MPRGFKCRPCINKKDKATILRALENYEDVLHDVRMKGKLDTLPFDINEEEEKMGEMFEFINNLSEC